MKVWITKYALTEGMYTEDVRECGDGFIASLDCPAKYYHGEGKEWHRTELEAVQRAEVMRKKKIESLKKQIAKLEKLSF